MTSHYFFVYLFRELATNIPDETLNADVEAVFEFEAQIAKVSANIVYTAVGSIVLEYMMVPLKMAKRCNK